MIAQEIYQNKIPLNELEDTWYIHQTNFPMWLKPNNKFPKFIYKKSSRKNKTVLYDKVIYKKKEKLKKIKGFDFPQNDNNTSFIWRGKGILSLIKSKWKIIYFNKEKQWAIIYFEKTLFTPSGYDVFSKSKFISSDLLNEINTKTSALNIKNLLTDIKQ